MVFIFLFLRGFEEGGGKVGGTKLIFSALLTEAGVGVTVRLCVWVEERACDGLGMDWSPCQVVGKQDPEAVLTEDGTECHLENKKGLCVVLEEGWELEPTCL